MTFDRVSAIIVRDKKLLLVTGYNASFFWTPGGKVEPGESHEAALRREVQEELDADISWFDPKMYFEFSMPVTLGTQAGNESHMVFYRAEIQGEPRPQGEISNVFWYDLAAHQVDHPKIGDHTRTLLLPKLISDGIL